MSKRKAIGNRLRFEIFKRDNFKCIYCGRGTPDVILHCDHVLPVSKGGTNDPVNLTTSCRECNSGKSNHLLENTIEPIEHRWQADKAKFRQMEELSKWLAEKSKILEDRSRQIGAFYLAQYGGDNHLFHPTDETLTSWKRIIERLPIPEIQDAIKVAFKKFPCEDIRNDPMDIDRFRYTMGICWNKIRLMEMT